MSNTALSTPTAPRRSALVTMASRLNVEEGSLLKTLKETVCKGCSDAELMAFSVVANEYGLNPFIKQIYAFPAKGGGIVPVVSIDGWVTMVNNHPQMDGMEFDYHDDEKGELEAITCTIWRKDRSRPIKVTEYLSECFRNTEPWKMKRRMLRHKTLMQCSRYAFGFSGIVDEDEGEDMRDVTPRADKPAGNPYRKTEKEAPAAQQAPEPAKEADAVVLPPRDSMIAQIVGAITAAGLKNLQALKAFKDAKVIPADLKTFSDASDALLFEVTQNLDVLPKPAPAEEKEEPAEETAPTDEKSFWISRLEDLGLGQEPPMNLTQVEAACRKAKVLGPMEMLKTCPVKRLEGFYANFATILVKANGEEGA